MHRSAMKLDQAPKLAIGIVACLTVLGSAAPRLNGQAPLDRFLVTWASADTGRIDRGTGIAYFATGAGQGTGADTMLVRARPAAGARVVGAFLYLEITRGIAWRYGVAASRPLQHNVVEYGYEESGVPLDSVAAGGGWARVILGFDSAGTPYRGWVTLDSSRVRHLLWRKVLAGNRVFFLDHQDARFFDQPNGRELPLQVRVGDNSDYILHPLEARGAWLRVRVAQPADICVRPDELKVRNTLAWIRYLSPAGRPTVWYYTRGC